jgi:hypothetical protein
MNEFINPKSMLTPGLAGSLMMFLVNGITFQFPEVPSRYLALFLSFLIGAIVWFSETRGKSPVLQKTVYWVLNSLVIFVVGFGTANLAAEATAGASKTGIPHARLLPFVSTAFAQGASSQGAPPPGSGQSQATIQGPSGSQSLRALEEKLATQQAENLRLKKQLESMQQEKEVSKQPESEKPFFKRW